MTPADRAWQLLTEGLAPQEIVARLTPATKPEAIHAARRLSLLAERPDGDRGAAMARIAARNGMRRFRLFFARDGRVADDPAYNRAAANPPKRELACDGCTVEYTARCYPDKDHFQFLGPPSGEPDGHGIVPRHPIPLSSTGYWSHFADPDTVAALGGPEAYLAALTAAGRDGAKEFERAFAGEEPEPARKARKPVVGKHTAKVAEPRGEVEAVRTGEPEESNATEPDPEPSRELPRGEQRSLFG